MIAIRKKYLAWAGWAVLAIILLTGATVGLAQVADEPELLPVVTIETVPLKVDDPVYIEYDGVVGHDEDDFVGIFDVYDGNGEIVFSWTPYEFAEGVNGAYRISLLQLLNPLDEEQEWAERKVAHHHADADAPTMFTYGSFGFGEEICETCPTYIIVWAETYVYDATGAPVYSPIAGLYAPIALSTDASIQASEPFVIEILRPEKAEPAEDEPAASCVAGVQGVSSGDWVLNAGCECGGVTLTGSAFGTAYCGGSLQDTDWATTATHCVCIVP